MWRAWPIAALCCVLAAFDPALGVWATLASLTVLIHYRPPQARYRGRPCERGATRPPADKNSGPPRCHRTNG